MYRKFGTIIQKVLFKKKNIKMSSKARLRRIENIEVKVFCVPTFYKIQLAELILNFY